MDCDLGCDGCGDGCDWSRDKNKPGKEKKGKYWANEPPDYSKRPRRGGGAMRRILRALALPALPDERPRVRRSPARWAGVVAIRCYQRFISPRLPTRCRYTPSCSQYGLEAVRAYGLVLGMRVALGRIQRCTRGVRHGTADMLPVIASRS